MTTAILTPAYGRDYKSANEARQAYVADKDFILENFDDPYRGKPVNRAQLRDSRYTSVQIRYRQNRSVTGGEL